MTKNFNKDSLLVVFLRSHGIVSQQIDSFNKFLTTNLKKIICNSGTDFLFKQPNVLFSFISSKIGSVTFENKDLNFSINPQTCRIRDITYSAPIFVNLCYYHNSKRSCYSNFFLCKIPIMLKSKKCILYKKDEMALFSLKECALDPGGYFIIKGTEKVVLIQEQLSNNRITIEKDKTGNLCSIVISYYREKRTLNTIVLKNKKLYFRSNSFIEDIPVFILIKAFGIDKDQEIVELIGIEFEDLLEWSLLETKMTGIVTLKQAVSYLSQRIIGNSLFFAKNSSVNWKNPKIEYDWENNILDFISKNILPHISGKIIPKKKLLEKGIFIALMTRRVLMAFGRPSSLNDKDYYGNKRFELAGQLISVLFEDLFNRANGELKKQHDLVILRSKKKLFDPISSFRSDIISNGLEHAFLTGNWTLKKYKMEKNGVSQILSRLSFSSSLSMITKIASSCEKVRKTTGPRSLQSSQWGMLCPSDTPEGESCGLVKSLTLLAHISTKEKSSLVLNLCFDLGVDSEIFPSYSALASYKNASIVFLNGRYIGFHGDTSRLLYSLRKLRRIGMLSEYVSVFWEINSRNVVISTDSGRVCRPFTVIESGKKRIRKNYENLVLKGILSWKDLLRNGFLEFLDINEQNNALVASDKKSISLRTTHMEIGSEILLGISISLIPFPDHNQSPRNTYQCAMGKQAIGAISFNQNLREDTILSVLNYPQKPLVKTKTLTISGNDKLPSGVNTCVCIMSYSGFDIEDAIIVNKSSIERGFFRGIVSRRHKIFLKDIFKPSGFYKTGNLQVEKKKTGSFPPIKNLDFSKKNNLFEEEDLKTENIEDTLFCKIRKANKNGIIGKIIISSNHTSSFFIKMIIRQTRKPEIGDKFSSRHGQKGICGLVSFQEDLPFSNEGMVPDLIMNPHGFPSRMTMGKMIELVESKVSSISGQFRDGTPFGKKNFLNSFKILKSSGYKSNGKELFFSGTSGEPLELEIFSGPVFYQKLKHMVQDKIHARSKGGRSNLTRQPTEGRSKGGGLRFGEMERDCLVSFGASELSIERLMFSSDLFNAKFDNKTGLLTHGTSGSNIISIKLPYACKLLFQELQSMNIAPKLTFEKEKDNETFF